MPPSTIKLTDSVGEHRFDDAVGRRTGHRGLGLIELAIDAMGSQGFGDGVGLSQLRRRRHSELSLTTPQRVRLPLTLPIDWMAISRH